MRWSHSPGVATVLATSDNPIPILLQLGIAPSALIAWSFFHIVRLYRILLFVITSHFSQHCHRRASSPPVALCRRRWASSRGRPGMVDAPKLGLLPALAAATAQRAGCFGDPLLQLQHTVGGRAASKRVLITAAEMRPQ